MYKIEFNNEMTIDGVIESFRNLKEAGIESYIEIDGRKIYWNDKDRDKIIKETFQKHKMQVKQVNCSNEKENANNFIDAEMKENDEVIRKLNRRQDLYYLSKDKLFMFELGTVLEYTKPEYVDEMLEYYVSVYGISSNSIKGIELSRNLNYMSELVLILNCDYSTVKKRFKIQEIINRIADNGDEKYKFDISVGRIEKYIIDGEKIRELLCLDILNDKLSLVNGELNKILNKKLF